MVEDATRTNRNFQVITEADGSRIVLPKRDIIFWRWFGAVPLVVGVVICGITSVVAYPYILKQAATGELPSWSRIVLIGIAMMAGLCCLLLSAWFTIGHIEIRVDHERFLVSGCIGSLRKTATRRLDNLAGIQVIGGIENRKPEDPFSLQDLLLGRIGLISARFGEQAPLLFAPGYSMPLLRAVTRELVSVTGRQIRDEDVYVFDGAEEQDLSGNEIDPAASVCPPLPEFSAVTFKPSARGITIILPPAGCMSVVEQWIVGTFFLFVGMWLGLGFSDIAPDIHWLFKLGVPLAICLVGVRFLIRAILKGRESAIVEIVAGHRLRITRRGGFKEQPDEWQRAELSDIFVGESRANDDNENGFPVTYCLNILPKQKRVRMVFESRDAKDLLWIAEVMRKALGIPLMNKSSEARVRESLSD